MTEAEKIDEELLDRELSKRLLGSFTTYTMPEYEMTANQGWKLIHEQIIEVLEAVERWDKKRVMIFCPPRLWKSELVSKRFPAWYLGRHPNKKVVVASYGADLASDFWRKAKEIATSQEFNNIFPDFELSKDKREGGNWETTKGGWMYTVWRGWALTGKWWDILIVDDIVKDREEAESLTIQTKTIDWYTSTFRTRKQNQDTAIVIMMTRWNKNDLAWFLLEQEKNWGEKWDVLTIQGIDETTNEEIIWPGKWDKWFMEEERENTFSKDWAALYQQDPIASSSNIFDMHALKYFHLSDFEKVDGILQKSDLEIWVFIDPAFSTNKNSDDAVVLGIGRHRISGEFYLLDWYADTSAPTKTYMATINMIDRLGQEGFPKITAIWIEDVPLNKQQTQFIKWFSDYLASKWRYYITNTHKPKIKKEERIKFTLEPVISMNKMNIRIDMKDESVVKKLESQLRDFPNGRNDDVIDDLSQGVEILSKIIQPRITQRAATRRTDDYS